MRLDVHVHLADSVALDLILSRLNRLENLGGKLMAKLEGLTEKVQKIEGVADAAIELIKGLRDQIANLEPTQEAIDGLAAELDAKAEALANAVATPPA